MARMNFDGFGVEELEEIGLLGMRLAALEEAVSLFCEILLIRPELGGFHGPEKQPVLAKFLAEKLTLYKMLTTAVGVLYGISTDSIEKAVVAVKAVGEDRNTFVHGILFKRPGDEVAFRNKNREVPATLGELRRLTKSCYKAAFHFVTSFSQFYVDLVGRKPTVPSIDAAVHKMLEAYLKLMASTTAARESTLAVREAEFELTNATRRAQESRQRLAVATRQLRNARSRERRRGKTTLKNG